MIPPSDLPAFPWPFRHFSREELMCPCCGECRIDPAFGHKLDQLREALGRPLIVSSGYRCPVHNHRVSTTGGDGPHTTGRAADIAISGGGAFALVAMATRFDFTGIGLNQKGASRFIHLDDLPEADGRPRPTIWTY